MLKCGNKINIAAKTKTKTKKKESVQEDKSIIIKLKWFTNKIDWDFL